MVAGGLLIFSVFCFTAALMAVALNTSWVVWWQVVGHSSLSLELPMVLDLASGLFSATVGVVSSAVFIFSRDYMKKEKYYIRFHLLLLSFVGCMFLLIISPNVLSMLLGWDGLGITSYLLVIYFYSAKSSNAGMLTVLTNRVGDLFILASIAILSQQGLFSLIELENHRWLIPDRWLMGLVFAGFTKSAQVPFSAWLPAAMAAPTPVSALVHSSTLVTAGVYLFVRMGAAFSNRIHWFVIFVGFVTMSVAGISATMELDMKKIVALSTLSQLGFMVTSVGAGHPQVAYIHLLCHAYFKALLFITVGNMIHMNDDFQDLRKAHPAVSGSVTMSLNMVANLSLCGAPFTTGFYSKDSVLEDVLEFGWFDKFIWILIYFSVFLTAAYTTRFILMTWKTTSRSSSLVWSEDSSKFVLTGGLGLYFLTILGGKFLTTCGPLLWDPLTVSEGVKNMISIAILSGGVGGWLLVVKSGKNFSLMQWAWGSVSALPWISSITPSMPLFTFSKMGRVSDLSWWSVLPLNLGLGEKILLTSEVRWPQLTVLTGGFFSFILSLLIIVL